MPTRRDQRRATEGEGATDGALAPLEPDLSALRYRPADDPRVPREALRRLRGPSYIDLLAALHHLLGVERYVEIGTQAGASLAVARGAALCIDPAFSIQRTAFPGKTELHLFQTTSDAFFARRDPAVILGGPPQLAFIDGMHHFDFALRDFIHCERAMGPEGVIVLHDCLPSSHALTERLTPGPDGELRRVGHGAWAGDVWKLLPILAKLRPDLGVEIFDAVPTGLVLVHRLNPGNATLAARCDRIVARRLERPDTPELFWRWLAQQQAWDTTEVLRQGLLGRILGRTPASREDD